MKVTTEPFVAQYIGPDGEMAQSVRPKDRVFVDGEHIGYKAHGAGSDVVCIGLLHPDAAAAIRKYFGLQQRIIEPSVVIDSQGERVVPAWQRQPIPQQSTDPDADGEPADDLDDGPRPKRRAEERAQYRADNGRDDDDYDDDE